jgi:hypothetical protein
VVALEVQHHVRQVARADGVAVFRPGAQAWRGAGVDDVLVVGSNFLTLGKSGPS